VLPQFVCAGKEKLNKHLSTSCIVFSSYVTYMLQKFKMSQLNRKPYLHVVDMYVSTLPLP